MSLETKKSKTPEVAGPPVLKGPDSRVFANPSRTYESDRRLATINETILSYQAEHPFIEGATVFGSTVHGGAHAESDIDAFVFVDPDQLPEEFSSVDAEGHISLTPRDGREMGRAIQVDLMQALGEKVTRNGKHEKNDVRVFALNEDIIHSSIEGHLASESAYQQLYDEHRAKEDLYYDRSYVEPGNEDWTPEQRNTYIAGMVGQRPEYPEPLNWAIAGLFHPAVGETDRIQEFRGEVMRDLGTRPQQEKDDLWAKIADTVKSFEGDLHSTTDESERVSFDYDTACRQFGYVQ